MIQDKKYRMPAEWEPQSGIQLTWPHAGTDWAPMLDEITATYQQMAHEIVKREKLLVVAPEGTPLPIVHYQLSIINSNDTWARDHGFITLVSTPQRLRVGATAGISPLLLDFCFNGWGEKFPADLDNAINRQLYDEGSVVGDYVDHLDFVLEGGSIESDGQGTIFTTTGCLLAPHRNQPLTKDEIESRLKEYLCADRVLWIDHGALTGDDTDGHIDTLVRICPNDTLLYVGCDDPQDEQYEELRLMEEQLRTFRTIDGRPYRLLKLPMPRPIYEKGQWSARPKDACYRRDARMVNGQCDRLPATYANFLIINGAVLCPTYHQPDLDAEAMAIIQQAFPDRMIVGIDCRSIIRQHGSLHCCTMQFPEGCL